MAVVGAVLGCSADAREACSNFSAGVQEPVEVQTSATLLPGGASIAQLIVDDSGLYWFDEQATVWSLPQGAAQPVALRDAPTGAITLDPGTPQQYVTAVNGFTSDGDFLYWGLANRYVGFDAGSVIGYSPPGLLLSITKTGSAPTVLAELDDQTIAPLAVDGDSLIVRVDGPEGGFYRFHQVGARLEPLPSHPPVDASRVVGDAVYWTEATEHSARLLRAAFDDATPTLVATIEGEFDVGPGYVLWRQGRSHTEPELILDENFVMKNDGTGCVQTLPGLGESISFSVVLDDQHVYWHSYNALGSVIALTPSPDAPAVTLPDGAGPSPEPEMPLIRVDLVTGVLEHLITPGFSSEIGDQLIGQDTERIYITTRAGLVAIDKP